MDKQFVTMVDDEGLARHLSPGQARTLAAGLVRAADLADGLDRDVNGSATCRFG